MANDNHDEPRSGEATRSPRDWMRLLNYREAAVRLGVDVPTLRGWVRRRLVPHIRVAARVVRFDPPALDRFIATRSVEPKP